MINNTWLIDKAKLVELPDGSYIYQHIHGQKISSDNQVFNDLLIERFSRAADQTIRVLELGSGNGINLIMLKKKFPNWDLTGIEIDKEQADLAFYNCKLLNLDIDIIKGDFRDFRSDIKYDLIIANPPYKRVGSGRMSPNMSNNIAKFELTCKMLDVFVAIKKNLIQNGEAWLLYSQDREEDLLELINHNKIDKITMIQKNKIIITGLKYVAN